MSLTSIFDHTLLKIIKEKTEVGNISHSGTEEGCIVMQNSAAKVNLQQTL